MKSRILFFLLLIVTLMVLLSQKNSVVHNTILTIINPIKHLYKELTLEVEDRSKSYLFQKESIQKLTKENKVLKKYLLDQTQYLQQVNSLFTKLPSLEKLPHKSIILVDTISYVKLNSFDEVLLTKPKSSPLKEDHVYGLIQKNSVGGTAIIKGGNLYGYLSSNAQCKFSVFIGEGRTPGIIQGVDNESMLIKYIPKWANIKEGDHVETSGLDGIFFANIPVGIIQSVKVENSYKTAFVKSFSDTLHPDFFFLISDPTPHLVSHYNQDSSELDSNDTKSSKPLSHEINVTSIPKTLQTKESEVDLSEFEIPKEIIDVTPIIDNPAIIKTKKTQIKINRKRKKTYKRTNPKKTTTSNSMTKDTLPQRQEKKTRNPLDIFR